MLALGHSKRLKVLQSNPFFTKPKQPAVNENGELEFTPLQQAIGEKLVYDKIQESNGTLK
jgi:hypothetical protein